MPPTHRGSGITAAAATAAGAGGTAVLPVAGATRQRCKVLRSLVLDRFEIFGEGLVSEVVEFFAFRFRAEQVAD